MNARRVRDIDYHLLAGSPRRTTDIVIERNGSITVRPPEHYTPEQVDAVVQASTLKVKDMGFRWASCGSQGQLNFHWKCMMAPPKIIDYIVVHELCHFYHKNHDDAFWNEVDKILPDYRERKEWLRKHGAGLSL